MKNKNFKRSSKFIGYASAKVQTIRESSKKAAERKIKMVKVKVEFLGGLDVIVDKIRIHRVEVPQQDPVTVGDLIDYIIKNMIKNANDVEVFIEDDNIRPGIITLINDTDWELEGEKEYVLEDGDIVSFTSTLHGG